MTYDDTDSNADGNIDSEVDNSLIDTANGELKDDVDAKSNGINNVGGIQAESINNKLIADPDATDIGAELNSLISESSNGDFIYIPPGNYNLDTTAVVDKRVTIFGDGVQSIVSTTSPTITKASDTTAIKTTEPAAIRGLSIAGAGAGGESDNSHGIHSTAVVHVENIHTSKNGGNGLFFEEPDQESGMNSSRAINISGSYNGGSLIKVKNSSGTTPDTNSMILDVSKSFQNNEYAIEIDGGNSNYCRVQQIEGSNHQGGIRLRGQRNNAEVQYAEGNVAPVIEFADNQNAAHVHWYGCSYDDMYAIDGNSYNNMVYQDGKMQDPLYWKGYTNHTFSGEPVNAEGGLITTSATANTVTRTDESMVVATHDDNYLINSGAVETLQLTADTDNLGEFDDTDHTFTPSETGWYEYTVQARWNSSSSDYVRLRFENAVWNGAAGSASGPPLITLSGMSKLQSGTAYSATIGNDDSNDTIIGGRLAIWRVSQEI